jgi:hypothetical protein
VDHRPRRRHHDRRRRLIIFRFLNLNPFGTSLKI